MNVTGCTINRDLESDTLGSATIDITESVGEAYIRAYLITIQNGIREKFPLGTFLVQTPSSSFDGKVRNVSMDAYTPLLELSENPPPIGYSISKNENIMDIAYRLCREHARAPVVETNNEEVLYDDFVSNTNDTWLTFISDLISNAKYNFALDEMGRILFAPKQKIESLQPVYTFNDDNSSILYPDIDMDHDIYGIPNVVEVVYSQGRDNYYARAVNDDINSPLSVQEYAEQLLEELSSVEYELSYTHGYCPVRIGDCVRLNYEKAGLKNIKAKVVSQNITCESGCKVTEKAVFTNKLWR